MSGQIEKSTNVLVSAPKKDAFFAIHRDPETGKQILQIPLPDERKVAVLCQTFSEILNGFSNWQKR